MTTLEHLNATNAALDAARTALSSLCRQLQADVPTPADDFDGANLDSWRRQFGGAGPLDLQAPRAEDAAAKLLLDINTLTAIAEQRAASLFARVESALAQPSARQPRQQS